MEDWPLPAKIYLDPPTLKFDEYVDEKIYEESFLNLFNKKTVIVLDFSETYIVVVAWMKLINKLAAQQTIIIRGMKESLLEIAQMCKLTHLLSSLESK